MKFKLTGPVDFAAKSWTKKKANIIIDWIIFVRLVQIIGVIGSKLSSKSNIKSNRLLQRKVRTIKPNKEKRKPLKSKCMIENSK